MSDEQKPAAQEAPASTETKTPEAPPPKPAASSPAAPQPAADPPEQSPAPDQHWLKDRLERERVKTLKAIGFDSVEAAKAAQAEYQAKLDAEKTAEQKAADAAAEAEKLRAHSQSLIETITARVDIELGQLTDEQRQAVTKIAGDDPAAQLRAIDTLRPTWVVDRGATPEDEKPAAPAPATTTPPRDAPSDGGPTSPPDHKATYERLRTENPIAAAHYLNRHGQDIYPDR